MKIQVTDIGLKLFYQIHARLDRGTDILEARIEDENGILLPPGPEYVNYGEARPRRAATVGVSFARRVTVR
jgi:hypothetical protein